MRSDTSSESGSQTVSLLEQKRCLKTKTKIEVATKKSLRVNIERLPETSLAAADIGTETFESRNPEESSTDSESPLKNQIVGTNADAVQTTAPEKKGLDERTSRIKVSKVSPSKLRRKT